MSVVEHLTELRHRLIVCFVAVALGGVVGFLLYNRILHFLLQPYCHIHHRKLAGCGLLTQDPLEPFLVRLKVAAWTGFAIASPVVFFQLWRFVTPGLNPKEKRYAVPFVLSSVLLFAGGGVVAWLTFPKALDFLVGVGGDSLIAIFSPSKYLRLIVLMIVAFGLAFEFPVLLVFLQLAHIITSRQLAGWWRGAIVVIFFVAAIITPSQDPYSLFAMAVPMCIFYGMSILIGRLLRR
ncbi:MAG: sec-independent protein translocase protein TatC [Acidimicrobiaceae bacterium]|jgi:sec-independent protein translocase protein TatC|nr:sec-independent protein translocase protein TatC [Acidimicrobiaceae bacterium]MDQ1444805.1 sec-independent protein translocase protein TatC [Acidimicrobiaceae bacterium]